jgi:hypothetical protein
MACLESPALLRFVYYDEDVFMISSAVALGRLRVEAVTARGGWNLGGGDRYGAIRIK